MINRVKNPTKYSYIEAGDVIKNYFVVGNLGAGKSTICNKIAHICQNGPVPSKKIDDVFESAQHSKSVTRDTTAKRYDTVQIIDTTGLADPQKTNTQQWIDFIRDIQSPSKPNQIGQNHNNGKNQIDLRRNGIRALIIPFMIPRNMRVEQ